MFHFSAQHRRLVATVCLSLLIGNVATGEGAKSDRGLKVGDLAPIWENLPGTDGQPHCSCDFNSEPAVVVIFLCNHCPCTAAYEQRIWELTEKYAKQQVAVVAINVVHHRGESLPEMTKRATEGKYNFPYIRDESQAIGKAFGATNTPHVFLLDGERKIAYRGAFDDSRDASKVQDQYLRSALDAVLAGKPVATPETQPKGCAIDYDE